MSFRSRTRSTQPIMPRRRSLSNSRVPTNTSYGPSIYSNGNFSSNYNIRPLSTGYYPGNTPTYQSPYTNHYGSRENLLYNSPRSGHYGNGNSVRDSYPKKTNSFNTTGMYDKRYGALTSYGSERYISPYSSYENGVTTAGFNINLNKSYPTKNAYTNSSSSNNSKKRDYTPVRNTNLTSTTPLSNSNSSLNSYSLNKPTKVSTGTNTPAMIINRSQSLREQERKSRSRTRNRQAAARSISASSEKSEGYESGSERTSRSRLGSTSSLAASEKGDSKTGNSSANGDVIDYKALWEAAKVENEKLKELLKKKDDEIQTAKAAVERFTNATSKNSLSELEKRERRAMERKLSEMEEELKLLQKLKTENERLRAENRALTRVVSKLTTSAQNQLQKKQ